MILQMSAGPSIALLVICRTILRPSILRKLSDRQVHDILKFLAALAAIVWVIASVCACHHPLLRVVSQSISCFLVSSALGEPKGSKYC